MAFFKKKKEVEVKSDNASVGEAATKGFHVIVNPDRPARLVRHEARLVRLNQRIAETDGNPNKAAKNAEWRRGRKRLEILIMLAKGEL